MLESQKLSEKVVFSKQEFQSSHLDAWRRFFREKLWKKEIKKKGEKDLAG
jgi:hypothetical protein